MKKNVLRIVKPLARHLGLTRTNLHSVLGPSASTSKLEAEQNDLQIAITQLQDAFVQSGALPLPPKHLQERVTGRYPPDFVKHGTELLADLEKILAPTKLSSFRRVLDFGCGCGRVLRAFHFGRSKEQELYGSDIDNEAISWCASNLQRVGKFSANEANPPTIYPDDFFDLVYSISVFTHLPEDMQFLWLAELQRIVKPGGSLILSFHGNYCLSKWGLSEEEYEKAIQTGFVYADHGPTQGLPSFYRMTYHSREYVREHWSKYFEILELRARSIHDFQDSALCRVR